MNASSPVCTHRVGATAASQNFIPNILLAGIPFGVTRTGYHNVLMNLTISWIVLWNTTRPNCTYSGTSLYFRCEVLASASFFGYGFVNHTKTGKPPAKYAPSNSSTPSVAQESYWVYTCKSGHASTCGVKTSGKSWGGIQRGTVTQLMQFRGWFNSTQHYTVGYDFLLEEQTDAWHSVGGSMVGGTGYARVDLRVDVNLITIS